MKIFVQEGCIAWATEVDEKDVGDMSEQEAKDNIMKLAGHIPPDYIQEFVKWFAEMFGEYEQDDKPCEQCGDIVCRYTWNSEEV